MPKSFSISLNRLLYNRLQLKYYGHQSFNFRLFGLLSCCMSLVDVMLLRTQCEPVQPVLHMWYIFPSVALTATPSCILEGQIFILLHNRQILHFKIIHGLQFSSVSFCVIYINVFSKLLDQDASGSSTLLY